MAEGQPDPEQSQSWLIEAQALLQQAEQGGAASRLRRARQTLGQAHNLGLSSAAIEQLGLESGLLALGRALEATGLNRAAQHCRERVTASQAIASLPATGLDALNRWVYPRSPIPLSPLPQTYRRRTRLCQPQGLDNKQGP